MQILINGQEALLKQKFSFEFVSENRYFSGADSYSMTITFPLKDCPQNLAIFGHINRKDVGISHILLECEIRCNAFIKQGSLAINEINDIEVKTQFLEGRSVDNYSTSFDEVYINELELGYPDTSPSSFSCLRQKGYDLGGNYVCFPWVNNNTGNMQNEMRLQLQHTNWETSVKGLSFQPYLIYLVGLILENLGYTYDFEQWKTSPYRLLIVCNALPYAWEIKNWAAALPHWTVTELLEQLEYLMNCEFDVDRAAKHVVYTSSHEAISKSGSVTLDRVLDDFTVKVEDGKSCKYREAQNFKYADCDHRLWKYYSCPKFIEQHRKFLKPNTEYRDISTFDQYLSAIKSYLQTTEPYKAGPQHCVYRVHDVDSYYILRRFENVITSWTEVDGEQIPSGTCYRSVQSLNRFGPLILNEEAETIELKIVPAWIDDTKFATGQVIFLPLGDYGTDIKSVDLTPDEEFIQMRTNADYYVNNFGEEESTEFLDKLYVGFSEGLQGSPVVYPRPTIDFVEMAYEDKYYTKAHSLALDFAYFKDSHYSRKIDPTHKYTFKFLANEIPNVRALFNIAGKQFLCEKITATFTENGMSELLKGDFYEVVV